MKINIRESVLSSTAVDISIFLFCFLIGVSIVNPFADFPLNDDWAFAKTVKRLLEFHMYVPTGWSAMSLLTNTLWGALFCLPMGFSFDALRVSTLIAAFAGVVGVYLGAKDFGVGRLKPAIAALILMFNPIFFALAHTFMTDVLFTALMIISAVCFLRYMENESLIYLVAAILFTSASVLSRQLGMAIPLAFTFAYLFLHGASLKSITRALLPLLICGGVLIFYQHWLSETGRMTALYQQQNERLLLVLQNPKLLIQSELVNGYKSLLYMGCFLLPLLLLALPVIWKRSRASVRGLCIAAILVGVSTYIFSEYMGSIKLPMLGNIFARFGIGPVTLKDTFILGGSIPELPRKFWYVVTGMALLGATLLLYFLLEFFSGLISEIRCRKITKRTGVSLFLWLSVFIYLGVVFASQVADRYLLPVIPLLSLAVFSIFSGSKVSSGVYFRSAAVMLVAGFSIFAVCTTKDYFSWNRARWQALNDLTQTQGLKSEDIDGGFEFNGLHLYDRNYRPRYDKSWWWVEGDSYMISFNAIQGYTVIKEYPYSHWLPPYEGRIVVSKKVGL